MNKLLSANFAHLWKSKVFWICVGGIVAIAVMFMANSYSEWKNFDLDKSIDEAFFTFALYIGAFCAAFISLFVGTEYSDGTIRNKLVVGHERSAIYLSNMIVSFVAVLLFVVAYLVVVSVVGFPLFGFFETEIKMVLILLLDSALLILAFTSMFTMLSMLNQNKAAVAVITLLAFFIMLFVSVYLAARLSESEIYENYMNTDTGIVSEMLPNPNYLRGTMRTVYQFLLDFLPTGQAVQMSAYAVVHPWLMALYSLLITVATTAIGLFGFQRKDIK